MDLFTHIVTAAQSSRKTVAIGLGDDIPINMDFIHTILTIAGRLTGKLILVGNNATFEQLHLNSSALPPNMRIRTSNNSSYFLISHLFGFDLESHERIDEADRFDAIIRGSIGSALFLTALSAYRMGILNVLSDPSLPPELSSELTSIYADFQKLPIKSYRLALLQSALGQQFYFGGVGIDEINTVENKSEFIDYTIQFLQTQDINPRIGILSGGRLGDLGRDPQIDQSITSTQNLCTALQLRYPSLHIKHYEILIEDAIQDDLNVILAPDGISGNLIYRTLVHLGAGKSYGAIFLPYYLIMKKIIIDSSRVAPPFEIEGAILFALGL